MRFIIWLFVISLSSAAGVSYGDGGGGGSLAASEVFF